MLHFRRAVDFINSDYPFSPAFGKATAREECAQSSQHTFDKLLVGRRKVLDFKDICKIAESPDGTNDKKKVLELVRLFQPNRAGEITKLEFVKSIDSVYKQLRLILANINSSSQIDRACTLTSESKLTIIIKSNIFNSILTLAFKYPHFFRRPNCESNFRRSCCPYRTFLSWCKYRTFGSWCGRIAC